MRQIADLWIKGTAFTVIHFSIVHFNANKLSGMQEKRSKMNEFQSLSKALQKCSKITFFCQKGEIAVWQVPWANRGVKGLSLSALSEVNRWNCNKADDNCDRGDCPANTARNCAETTNGWYCGLSRRSIIMFFSWPLPWTAAFIS